MMVPTCRSPSPTWQTNLEAVVAFRSRARFGDDSGVLMDDLPPRRYTELWASGSLTITQKQRKLANKMSRCRTNRLSPGGGINLALTRSWSGPVSNGSITAGMLLTFYWTSDKWHEVKAPPPTTRNNHIYLFWGGGATRLFDCHFFNPRYRLWRITIHVSRFVAFVVYVTVCSRVTLSWLIWAPFQSNKRLVANHLFTAGCICDHLN